MLQEQFPFDERPRITSEVLAFYITRARDERAKAIAEFGGHVATWAGAVFSRLFRRSRRDIRHMTGAPTA